MRGLGEGGGALWKCCPLTLPEGEIQLYPLAVTLQVSTVSYYGERCILWLVTLSILPSNFWTVPGKGKRQAPFPLRFSFFASFGVVHAIAIEQRRGRG